METLGVNMHDAHAPATLLGLAGVLGVFFAFRTASILCGHLFNKLLEAFLRDFGPY